MKTEFGKKYTETWRVMRGWEMVPSFQASMVGRLPWLGGLQTSGGQELLLHEKKEAALGNLLPRTLRYDGTSLCPRLDKRGHLSPVSMACGRIWVSFLAEPPFLSRRQS